MNTKIEDILFEIALDQHGFVTSGDARAQGLDPFNLVMLCRRGRITHIGHGLYRFERFPTSPLAPFMEAVMWTGRTGVVSHDSALDLHELCGINPNQIHLTIPGRRPRRPGGDGIVTHRGALSSTDVTVLDGIPIVTPLRAIAQGIDTGVPSGLILESIGRARRTGRLTPTDARDLKQRLDEANQ